MGFHLQAEAIPSAARFGAWELAATQHIGKRHLAQAGRCEDTSGWYFDETQQASLLGLALADGVSGGARGDIASQAYVRYCTRLRINPLHSDAQQQLQTRLRQLDDVVANALKGAGAAEGATTGCAAWLVDQGQQGAGWITRTGDCRIYRWQSAASGNHLRVTFETLTYDQSYRLLAEVPPTGIPPCNPARMAGNGCMGEPGVIPVNLPPGSGLLLCSDGIHGCLPQSAIQAVIEIGLRKQTSLGRMAVQLQNAARHVCGADDTSVLLVRYQGE